MYRQQSLFQFTTEPSSLYSKVKWVEREEDLVHIMSYVFKTNNFAKKIRLDIIFILRIYFIYQAHVRKFIKT